MAEQSKLWYLENFNFFEMMKKSEMMELDAMTSMQEVKKSQPIYFAEDPSQSIFFLKKGRVKLSRISPDGKEFIVALINPGEVFGEMSILDVGERTDFATTMEESLICAISKDDFKAFVEKNPKLNLEITKLIGFRMRKYSERIEELVFKDAEQRVISFIYNLSNEQGKRIGDEIFLKPFLTHENIAQLTACSRQTVNSILTDLRDKGLIDFDRKKLIIHNENELKKLK
jgi:CRP/FNR family transcriptional regulator, cyclic AMP receptor protein